MALATARLVLAVWVSPAGLAVVVCGTSLAGMVSGLGAASVAGGFEAADLKIDYVDQLIPRLLDKSYGPVLFRHTERQGTYEFVNPVLRL